MNRTFQPGDSGRPNAVGGVTAWPARGRGRLGVLWLAVSCLVAGLPPAGLRAASLSVSRETLAPGTVLDLPALGGLDWAHWGLATTNDLHRRDTPAPVLINFAVLGTALLEQTPPMESPSSARNTRDLFCHPPFRHSPMTMGR